ncbi:cystathionine gamma-lyase [Streptomyces californicus]
MHGPDFRAREQFEPPLPGPGLRGHFHLSGDPTGPYTYGRDTNPTRTHLERAIGELEAPGEEVADHGVRFGHGGDHLRTALPGPLGRRLRCLPDYGYQALPLVMEQLGGVRGRGAHRADRR